jgi:predicted acylesterase/phospholipase RssA
MEELRIVDGGVTNNYPSNNVEAEADIVIGCRCQDDLLKKIR